MTEILEPEPSQNPQEQKARMIQNAVAFVKLKAENLNVPLVEFAYTFPLIIGHLLKVTCQGITERDFIEIRNMILHELGKES